MEAACGAAAQAARGAVDGICRYVDMGVIGAAAGFAAFNIGVAVGSVHVLPAGVYIAMCGAVISHERCRRDMKTGAFVAVP